MLVDSATIWEDEGARKQYRLPEYLKLDFGGAPSFLVNLCRVCNEGLHRSEAFVATDFCRGLAACLCRHGLHLRVCRIEVGLERGD